MRARIASIQTMHWMHPSSSGKRANVGSPTVVRVTHHPNQPEAMKTSKPRLLLAVLMLTPVVTASAQEKPAQPKPDKP
jgi:hypothetical protein